MIHSSIREGAAVISGISGIADPKLAKLTSLLRDIESRVVVFCDAQRVQKAISEHLRELRRPVFSLYGDRRKIKQLVSRFQDEPRAVLIAAANAQRGLNLQDAFVVINYDVPWDPSLLEQRIGRVCRIGQTHRVQVHTLYYAATLEEHLVRLYMTQLGFFEFSIGEINLVLDELNTLQKDAVDFTTRVWSIWLEAKNEKDLARRFAKLGQDLEGVSDVAKNPTQVAEGLNTLWDWGKRWLKLTDMGS